MLDGLRCTLGYACCLLRACHVGADGQGSMNEAEGELMARLCGSEGTLMTMGWVPATEASLGF